MGGHEENKGNYGIQRKGTGLQSNAMDKDMNNGLTEGPYGMSSRAGRITAEEQHTHFLGMFGEER